MIQSIIFILAMTFIPYFVGCGCILLDRKTGDIDVLEKWNFGMVLMHAIFEIVVLAGTFTKDIEKRYSVLFCDFVRGNHDSGADWEQNEKKSVFCREDSFFF